MKTGIYATVSMVINTTDAFKTMIDDMANQAEHQFGKRPTLCYFSKKLQSLIPKTLRLGTITFRTSPKQTLAGRQIWLGFDELST